MIDTDYVGKTEHEVQSRTISLSKKKIIGALGVDVRYCTEYQRICRSGLAGA